MSVGAVLPVSSVRMGGSISAIHGLYLTMIAENTRRKRVGLEPVHLLNPNKPIPSDLRLSPPAGEVKRASRPVNISVKKVTDFVLETRHERAVWELRSRWLYRNVLGIVYKRLGGSRLPPRVVGQLKDFVWALWMKRANICASDY